MPSISDLVVKQLDRMRFLHSALKLNLVNYSAISRIITPAIERELKEPVKAPAVLAAIQRYADSLKKRGDKFVNPYIKDCELILKTDFFCAHFKKTQPLMSEMLKLRDQASWESQERFYIVERTGDVSIAASEKFKQKILELGKADKTFLLQENLALLSIMYPPASIEAPGLLSFFANKLEQMQVNVVMVFSSLKVLSFVINENDAARVIEEFKIAIKEEEKSPI